MFIISTSDYSLIEIFRLADTWVDWISNIFLIVVSVVLPTFIGYKLIDISDDFISMILAIIFAPIISIILVTVIFLITAILFSIISNFDIFGPLMLILIVGAFIPPTYYVIVFAFRRR